MAVISRWRQRAREVINAVLESLPAAAPFRVVKRALLDAYPFGPRENLPYRMWCIERRRALNRLFPQPQQETSREQVVVTRAGIFCSWCRVRSAPGRPGNPMGAGCLACTTARTEWDAGAEAIVLSFADDTPPGIIADRLEEEGYDACVRLLRKE